MWWHQSERALHLDEVEEPYSAQKRDLLETGQRELIHSQIHKDLH